MASGQYRVLILLLVILGIEMVSNPAVKAVVGGWLTFARNTPQIGRG